MTAEDAHVFFVKKMQIIFGDPPGDDPLSAAMVYVRPLARFGPEVLAQTAEHFQLTARKRSWPMPADVIEVAERKANVIAAQRRAEEARKPRTPPVDQLQEEAIYSDLGLTAAREGWITFLFDFVGKHERHPDDSEQAALRDQAKDYYGSAEEKLGPRYAEVVWSRRRNMVERVQNWARTRQPAVPVG